jgi:hypothetical protein
VTTAEVFTRHNQSRDAIRSPFRREFFDRILSKNFQHLIEVHADELLEMTAIQNAKYCDDNLGSTN